MYMVMKHTVFFKWEIVYSHEIFNTNQSESCKYIPVVNVYVQQKISNIACAK